VPDPRDLRSAKYVLRTEHVLLLALFLHHSAPSGCSERLLGYCSTDAGGDGRLEMYDARRSIADSKSAYRSACDARYR